MKRRFSGYDQQQRESEEQILLKLPVKSLLRFKSVCKSWKSLITSQKFVNDHLQASIHKSKEAFADKNSSPLLLVLNETWEEQLVSQLTISDSALNVDLIYGTKLLEVPPSFDLLLFNSHCHGILCLVVDGNYDHGERVLFYNPALREQRSFLIPRLSSPYMIVSYAFGHDPKTDDYKFVRISNRSNASSKVEVYSLGTSRWREFEIKRVNPCSSGTYLKGGCYWIDRIAKNLLLFDMSDESFSSLDLPRMNWWCIDGRNKLSRVQGPWVMVRGESLVCIVDTFRVWVLDEDRGVWTKQIKIDRPSAGLVSPVEFWKEDEWLMEFQLEDRDIWHLSMYNINSRRLRKLPVLGTVSLYVESLVSVNKTTTNDIVRCRRKKSRAG